MITDAIFSTLLGLLKSLLLPLTTFQVVFTIPVGVANGLMILFANIGYIFPVAELMPILLTGVGLRFIRIPWALIIRIKSFIPTMGS